MVPYYCVVGFKMRCLTARSSNSFRLNAASVITPSQSIAVSASVGLLQTVLRVKPDIPRSSSANASPYLMTLSALTSTFCGMVRPIFFAAFKLITRSNFAACSTGRSAGFAPFKILSTINAARLGASDSAP